MFIDTFISNSEIRTIKIQIKNKELELLHREYVQCHLNFFTYT
jgi:hypothetical protein